MTIIIYILAILSLFLLGLNLLPSVGSYPAIESGVLVITGYMKSWNFLFPIDILFIVVGIITTVEISIWFFKTTRWVLHFLRGHQ